MNKKVLIIIPARDEAKNIGSVLSQIKDKYGDSDAGTLVVDDASKDKTSLISEGYSAFLLKHKKSLGVCLSVIDGFLWGIKKPTLVG